jgi:hypothetical protein
VKLIRIRSGKDGESHVEELELPLERAAPRAATVSIPASSTAFGFLTVREAQDWHPAPRRQLVAVLSGALEVACADGSRVRFRAGEAFIADDLTGRGHVTRYPEGPVNILYVHLPDDIDFSVWAAPR